MALRTWLDRYLKSLRRRGYSPKSIDAYSINLRHFVGYLVQIGIDRAGEIDRDTVLSYQSALYTATAIRGPARPLSLKTQAHRLITVQGFLRFLVKEGQLLFNPAADLELPKAGPRNPPRNVPTEAEVTLLLSAPDPRTVLGIRDRALLETLYSTGMRVGELVRLKLYDIDLTRGMAQVIGGKGGKDRVVPLGRMAIRALRAYLKSSRPKLLRNPAQNALFLSYTGEKHLGGAIRHLFRLLNVRLKLARKITPHGLRHACATHMLRRKASIRHIQELLGHRQLSTTQLYTHVEIEDLKAVHRRTHPREKLPPEKS